MNATDAACPVGKNAIVKTSAARTSHWGVQAASYAPLIVGGAFLYYGIHKMVDLSATILSIDFLFHKIMLSKILAVLVAATDLYLGLWLFFSDHKRKPVLVSLCCLGVYSLFLCYLVSMKEAPGCGCGGMLKFFESNRANSAVGLGRNLVFAGLLLWYWRAVLARGRVVGA